MVNMIFIVVFDYSKVSFEKLFIHQSAKTAISLILNPAAALKETITLSALICLSNSKVNALTGKINSVS